MCSSPMMVNSLNSISGILPSPIKNPDADNLHLKKSCGMESIPNEVVRIFFEYLSWKQRSSIARVCKVWAFLRNTFPEQALYQAIKEECDIFNSKPTKCVLYGDWNQTWITGEERDFCIYQASSLILRKKGDFTYSLTKYVKNWFEGKKYWDEFKYSDLKNITEFVFNEEKIEFIMPTGISEPENSDTIGKIIFKKDQLENELHFDMVKLKKLDENDKKVIVFFEHCLEKLRSCEHFSMPFPSGSKAVNLKILDKEKFSKCVKFNIHINNPHSKFTFQSLAIPFKRLGYNYEKMKIKINNTTWIETNNKKEIIEINNNKKRILSNKEFRQKFNEYKHREELDIFVENASPENPA